MQRSNNARAIGEVQIRFLSARAHENSASCSRSGEGEISDDEVILQPVLRLLSKVDESYFVL